MLSPVIFKAIRASDEICALLGTFEALPAVFTTKLPDKCVFPAVLINDVNGADFGTRGDTGGVSSIDVQVFDDKDLSIQIVRDIAKKIRQLLNRADLEPWITDAGFSNYGCIADPPQNTNDGLGFPGYTIRVTVRYLEV